MNLRPFQSKDAYGWVRTGLQLPSILSDPAAGVDGLEGETVLDCRSRKIVRIPLRFNGSARSCFAYFLRNQSLTRAFRRSYSLHTLRLAQRLRDTGFDSLEVLAAIAPRGQYLNWKSILVASEIQSVFELPSSGNHVFQIHPTIAFGPDIAAALGQELARFHRSGFFHGDLKTRHILVRLENSGPESQRLRFFFVDLEKARYIPGMPSRLASFLYARDLVQFFASLPSESDGQSLEAERELMLKEYFSAASMSASEIKSIQKILCLYRSNGGLRQGQTLLKSGLEMLKDRWLSRNHSDD